MMIYVPLSQIADNPYQRRTEYGDIEELAADIQRHKTDRPDTLGLLQLPTGRLMFRNAAEPDGRIILRDQVGKLLSNGRLAQDPALTVQLQFAHRRKRAFDLLAATDPDYAYMPILLGDITDDQMLDGVWSENRARKDLSAVEEAELLQLKLRQLNASQREVADAWGLARPTVANRLRLLELPPEVQQANRDGRLSERQCLALLPVLEIQQQADTAVAWGSPAQHWGPPVKPTVFIDQVIGAPDKLTSDNIRDYTKRALEHAGRDLPSGIAKFECPPDGTSAVQQATCRGCPARLNNICLNSTCLTAKKAAYGTAVAMTAAADLGYRYSDDPRDFEPFEDASPNVRRPLAQIHEAGGCAHIVVGWTDGWGVRPYSERPFAPTHEQYAEGSKVGVTLGHRGDIVPDCMPDGGGEAEEEREQTIPADLLEVWQKAGKKQMKQIDTAVTEAVTNQLRRALADPLALAGIMSLGNWPQWKDGNQKDDPDTIIKHLVGHMHSRGSMAYNSDSPFERHRKAVRVLIEAGLDPTLLDIAVADDPRGVVTACAVRVLLHWKNNRHYTWDNSVAKMQPEILECRRAFDRVGVMGDGAAELSMWLDLAAQDVEKRLAAMAAKAATPTTTGTAYAIAGAEDADLYDDEDEGGDYDDYNDEDD